MVNFRGSNKKGIFLIEVIISVVILGIAVTSILYALQSVLRAFKVSNEFTKSIYLAEYLLFQENYDPESVENSGQFPDPNDNFVWELKREPVSKTGNVYRVKVSILGRENGRMYAELTTLIKKWQISTP